MIDEVKFIEEMHAGIRRAFEIMAFENLLVPIYSIGIWTDIDAKRSGVSFDTFENSETKRESANILRQRLRSRFISEGDPKRASLVPNDMLRNNNPADFAFHKVIVIENYSLGDARGSEDFDWNVLSRLLEQVKHLALRECHILTLHRDAELGINNRNTWYGDVLQAVTMLKANREGI